MTYVDPRMYGAALDGRTDDTNGWQAACNAAQPGDIVDPGLPSYRSLITHLSVPRCVKLCKAGIGPFDAQTNPWTQDLWGPTLGVVQDSVTPAITLAGHGSGLGDAIIYSTNQVDATAKTPTAFAPLVDIGMSVAGCRIDRPYLPNAWIGINVRGGRHVIDCPQIGALHRGIVLDHCYDFVRLNAVFSPYWDIMAGVAFPNASGLDAYVLNAGGSYSVEVNRCDGLNAGQILTFGAHGVMLWTDSPDSSQGTTCGHGTVAQIQGDAVSIGIQGKSIQAEGLEIAAIDINGNNIGVGQAGQYGIWTSPGGQGAPVISVASWSVHNMVQASLQQAGAVHVPPTNPGA